MVAHACNHSTLGGRGRRISEFEVSLVYRVNSRTTRAIQRNPVSKKPNPKNQPQQAAELHSSGCVVLALESTMEFFTATK